MKVAVIGSGLSGLACALKLLEEGFEVHVFENENDVGGLAGYVTLGNYRFPRTYHHVLRSDKPLNEALKFFKIAIDWRNVKIGFYVHSKIFPFNGPFDLLRFSPLSLADRFRLGWLVLNTKYNEQLRDISVKEWTVSKTGGSVYENFVSPLISTYFGSSENIAAAYLAQRWSDESKYASNSLGYTDFPQLVDSYVDWIGSRKGVIKTDCGLRAVRIGDKEVIVVSNGEEYYDAVVLTCPTPESKQLLEDAPQEVIDQLDTVEYRACLCLALLLEEKISNYYWVNILDRKIPFIACFEHGNLNPNIKGGLVYAVAYVNQMDKLWNLADEEIYRLFEEGLKKVFKSSPKVKEWALFRARYGTPIYKVGYRNIAMNPCPRLYFAGVYRAFPKIRSSGPAIRTGIEAAEKIAKDLR
ncbi:MAG: FAD-dependent oxidoreductase [Candidatus Bathyarchaeota archaeon]